MKTKVSAILATALVLGASALPVSAISTNTNHSESSPSIALTGDDSGQLVADKRNDDDAERRREKRIKDLKEARRKRKDRLSDTRKENRKYEERIKDLKAARRRQKERFSDTRKENQKYEDRIKDLKAARRRQEERFKDYKKSNSSADKYDKYRDARLREEARLRDLREARLREEARLRNINSRGSIFSHSRGSVFSGGRSRNPHRRFCRYDWTRRRCAFEKFYTRQCKYRYTRRKCEAIFVRRAYQYDQFDVFDDRNDYRLDGIGALILRSLLY